MTDTSTFGRPIFVPHTSAKVQTAPRPKPERHHMPVFIGDAVTPLGGETLLSVMMKRMMKDAQDDPF